MIFRFCVYRQARWVIHRFYPRVFCGARATHASVAYRGYGVHHAKCKIARGGNSVAIVPRTLASITLCLRVLRKIAYLRRTRLASAFAPRNHDYLNTLLRGNCEIDWYRKLRLLVILRDGISSTLAIKRSKKYSSRTSVWRVLQILDIAITRLKLYTLRLFQRNWWRNIERENRRTL